MLTLSKAKIEDIAIIQEIAKQTWPKTYGLILSDQQLKYMLKLMYSDTSLVEQFNGTSQFFIAKEEDNILGFASFEANFIENTTRIHKIYILPEAQGKGIGQLFIEKAKTIAQKNQNTIISLNVNKHNKAVLFYQKMGFEIVAEEILEIGNGFVMDDYKMEKCLIPIY